MVFSYLNHLPGDKSHHKSNHTSSQQAALLEVFGAQSAGQSIVLGWFVPFSMSNNTVIVI